MNIEQECLIRNGDWDYLIVLDACRFDFFERQVNDFFHGELLKTISAGSCTLDWCKNTFDEIEFSDVVYVSSNPFINSKKELKGFKASKVFKKVIDVWLDDWDDNLGTVHPSKVTEAAEKTLRNNPEKMIIHYLQPHEPYLFDKYKTPGFAEPSPEMNKYLSLVSNSGIEKSFPKIISCARKINPRIRAKIKTLYLYYLQFLGRPPFSPLDDIRRRFSVEGLRDAYSLNLSIVLEEACTLYNMITAHSPGARVVITSDHGEILGEGREYGHVCGRNADILLKIPWFKVEKVQYGSKDHTK